MKPNLTLPIFPLAFSFINSPALTTAWLPWEDRNITSTNPSNKNNITNLFESSNGKIRGVNIPSLFVFEPWIAKQEWTSMGCGDQLSEFDCVLHLGQDAADSAFQRHWNSWITREDISEITSMGLNTVRIPVGYWMYEELVDQNSDHFPRGGWGYFERLCKWAGEEGVYVIVDLHGAPGAQVQENPDTGQYASDAGFYNDSQYDRALKFLEWMTKEIHSNDNLTAVGMVEIVNEPVRNAKQVSSMRMSYYPNAINRIRTTESSMNVPKPSFLHIQMMSKNWGSGDPKQALNNDLKYFLAYDEHRYIKYDKSIPVNQNSYISASCKGLQEPDTPTIVSEWSLSPPDNVEKSDEWNPDKEGNKEFYRKWFAAQLTSYERDQAGWVFWGWKQQLGDYRWGYRDAIDARVIPANISSILNKRVCR